ncbi:MAG TPA: ferrous iron transport protein A [Chromatiaceae bacterium]|nr:ferrous iron transport protein A [Chromatiaceae bacterium]
MYPVTLDILPPGTKARVVDIRGRGGWIYRLYQMGLTPGITVEVVANYGRGPIVIRVRGIEVAIGRGVARRILVSPTP